MSEKSLEGLSPEQIEAAAAMYQSLVSNPATREMTLRATKTVNPGLSIPEVDLKDMAAKEFAKRDKRAEEQDLKIIALESEKRIDKSRAALITKGFKQEDVDAIEKIMVDNQIPNYDTAAEFYKNRQTVAEPTPSVPVRGNTFTMPDMLSEMKGGRNSLNRAARNAGTTALDEIRSGRVKLPH